MMDELGPTRERWRQDLSPIELEARLMRATDILRSLFDVTIAEPDREPIDAFLQEMAEVLE
jgi:hypothetical protein